MSWALGSRDIESVLVSRLRYLGDIVMSTVLIDVLKQGDPDLVIGYLCEDEYADVLAGHEGLARLHRLRSNRQGSDAKARPNDGFGTRARGTTGTVVDLRRASYDLAVDLFFNPRSAWLLKLAGIPRRIGGTTKWRGRLYTHRVLRPEVVAQNPEFDLLAPGGLGEHLCRLAPLTQVESGLDFATWLQDRYVPGDLMPRLTSPAAASVSAKISRQLGRLTIGPHDPYLLLAPCATWPTKEWSGHHWRELLALMVEQVDLPLAVLVSPGREADWKDLAAVIPAGRGGILPPVPLAEALALTVRARALVTVDGGIMHAAVGYGVPTVALFGPTDPGIWFPYQKGGPYRVLATAPDCHPCDLHECPAFICLPQLEATEVWETLSSLLAATAPVERERP